MKEFQRKEAGARRRRVPGWCVKREQTGAIRANTRLTGSASANYVLSRARDSFAPPFFPALRRCVKALPVFCAPLICAVLLTGCRRDMQDQPKYKPYRESAFFGDGKSARPLIEGTVARGLLKEDSQFYTGKTGPEPAAYVTGFPLPVTEELLDRGQERFNINCSPCHGLLGDGEGMVAKRGFRHPPSYHIDRLRNAPPGYFFDVMTNGFGAMPDYAAQITPPDRWAIVAYIRALQLSQNATLADVPAEEREHLGSKEQR